MSSVSSIRMLEGTNVGAIILRGDTLPTTDLQNGRLFFLRIQQQIYLPGLYIYEDGAWISARSAGAITQITAGYGLKGGGTNGNVSIAVDPIIIASQENLTQVAQQKLSKSGDLMNGIINMQQHKIINIPTPELVGDAVNKSYVDTSFTYISDNFVNKQGSTMTGYLSLVANPILDSHAVTKYYVDTIDTGIHTITDSPGIIATTIDDEVTLQLDFSVVPSHSLVTSISESKLSKNGDTMTGILSMGNNRIVNVLDPVSNTDGTNKQYVDTAVAANGVSTIAISFTSNHADKFIVVDDETQTPYKIDKSVINLSGFSNDARFISDSITVPVSTTSYFKFPTLSSSLLTGYNDRDILISTSSEGSFAFCGNTALYTISNDAIRSTVLTNTSNNVSGIYHASANKISLYSNLTTTWSARNEYIFDGGNITINSNNVWHAGNDGASSGLDADLLDGQHGSYYLDYNHLTNAPLASTIVHTTGSTMTGVLVLNANPTNALEAAPKQYVDTRILRGGDTMTGALVLNADPVNVLGAATKQYVDARVSKSGDTMTGALILHADPINPLGAATKQYVDTIGAGLAPKASVRVATTANISLSGLQTIDDISLLAGDRVLVKNQTTATENGIYIVSSGSWTRATDADTSAEIIPGMYMYVQEGTNNGRSSWILTTPNPITLNTTNLQFSIYNSPSDFTFSTGLVNNSNTITVDTTYLNTQYARKTSIDVVYTVSYNATVTDTHCVFFVDTSSTPITITLLNSPSIGDQITIIDLKGTFGTNNCTIHSPSAWTIMGLAEDMTVSNNYASVTLICSGNSTTGWRLRY